MRLVSLIALIGAGALHCDRSRAPAAGPEVGGTPAAGAAPRLATPQDALAAFLSAWNLSVLPHVRENERGAMQVIDRAMRGRPERLTARREPCREGKDLVERTNRECEYDFVVYGALAELDREGECWRVMYEGGMEAEAIGYLDPAGGRLLLVWRVPEG
jgi:hypothetical protein